MPENTSPIWDEPRGLPVRSRKTKPETEEPKAIVQDEGNARRHGEEKPRSPGDQETIIDERSGAAWTLTLPSAEVYKRVMGRRYASFGETFSMKYTSRLRTLMQECISPQPDLEKMSFAELDWLTRSFWFFLHKDRRISEEKIDLEKPHKPHDVLEFRSPFTNRLYALFIPTAAEVLEVLPSTEDRADPETGDMLIELSSIDPLLERYLEPRLTQKFLSEIVPMELEWLELTSYLFLRFRK